ncbi:related to phosphatase 2a inhibitor [Phialocephala subalpina]|uniref:Related to phosphatase 2a inhibitor n=1 Tax=Phialocephala subalpina TaxID=576137 RepID=A0A1L7XK20_9HELO|nr:related to phosphatase 2a inhibitor [Phialocephala subalpina]
MAAALEETPVSYEDLADIEREFDDVETEIIRQQVRLTTPLYAHRTKTVSQIPNFWPLVLEQAPPDIDQYIQPSDSALLLSSLTNLSVSHFEISQDPTSSPKTNGTATGGDPRSVSIRFEFADNEYFEDKVLEKKFWYRRARDGWTGLVSEPVPIKWKKDRDLTGGLLDLVIKAEASSSDSTKGLTPEQRALKKKIENTGMGGLSFFAWFGFIGRRVSAEESAEATALELKKRSRRKGESGLGTEASSPSHSSASEDEEQEEDDVGMSLEIFPDGDDLAVAFTEDLWPGAIKYFTQAQEQDALSDADFESDDEGDEPAFNSANEHESEEDDGRPTKKQRSS